MHPLFQLHLQTIFQRFNTSKTSLSYLEKGSKSKMEQNFESCWGNRSSPLKKIFEISNTAYFEMEKTAFGKIPLVSKVPPPPSGASFIAHAKSLTNNETN